MPCLGLAWPSLAWPNLVVSLFVCFLACGSASLCAGVAVRMCFWPAPCPCLVAGWGSLFAGFCGLCLSRVVCCGFVVCTFFQPAPPQCVKLGRRVNGNKIKYGKAFISSAIAVPSALEQPIRASRTAQSPTRNHSSLWKCCKALR